MYATRRKNKKISTFLKLFVEFLAQYTDVYCICTVKQNKGIIRKPSKEIRKLETELIYYIRLYRELRGREFVENLLMSLDSEINLLVEKLKRM